MIPISKPFIGKSEKQAVIEVLESGMLAQGPRVAALEERFAALCGCNHAIATSSGTTALHVSLLAHGIGPGDEVITTPFTFIASVNSILYTGATPVFVDVLPCCFNIDPMQVEAAISPKTKAIIPVHLYGQPCEMDKLVEIAERHNLCLIEDAAQAVGALYDGRPVGGFGTGCFSLYATKNIMSGEGGIITTNDPEVAANCRSIRAHGMKRRYYHDHLGYNYRMSDLHAAIGLAQMDHLEAFTKKRQANAKFLNEHIQHERIVTPMAMCDGERHSPHPSVHVWHQYTIRVIQDSSMEAKSCQMRDTVVARLTDAGIGTGIFYPVPAHAQKHVRGMGYEDVSMPVAEQLANEVISLPVHPQLSQEDLEHIAQAVNAL